MKHLFDADFDKNGEKAKAGKVRPEIVDTILKMDYFAKAPPKSTGTKIRNSPKTDKLIGREYFSNDVLLAVLTDKLSIPNVDVITSITEVTCRSISSSIIQHREHINQVIVSGGGARNSYIMERLNEDLTPHDISVRRADNSDFTEALGSFYQISKLKEN